jgi:hypothetical protein
MTMTATTTSNGRSKARSVSAKEAWETAPQFAIAAEISQLKVAVWHAKQCETQLQAALVYANYGVPVIPCNCRQNQGETKINKHPLNKPGVYGATTDPELIKVWWTRWPQALIGVPGGRRTGVWFLDVDAKQAHGSDGLGNWARLEAQHDAGALTRTHLTGTDGRHLVYLWEAVRPVGCPVSTVPEGIEVKGEGGYVIFPPSPYQLGDYTVAYRVLHDDDPAAAPAWLYDLILDARAQSKAPAAILSVVARAP